MKKKQTLVIAIIATVVILALLIPFVVSRVTSNQEKAAFSSSNPCYDHVMIAISQKGEDCTPKPGEGTYNDDISLDGDTVDQDEYDVETTISVTKDMTTYYEETESAKKYFHIRDGAEYLLYFSRDYGTDDQGEWAEVLLADTQVVKSFDFAILDNVDLNRMEKDGHKFSANEDYRDELLALMLALSDITKKDYRADRITFVLDGDRIGEIQVEFAYNANLYMQYEYVFTYQDTALSLPEVG